MFRPILLNEDDWVRRLGPCRFQFWACRLIGPLTYRMGSVGLLGSGTEPMVPTHTGVPYKSITNVHVF